MKPKMKYTQRARIVTLMEELAVYMMGEGGPMYFLGLKIYTLGISLAHTQ